MPEIAGQRPAPASVTRGNINDFHRPGKISQETELRGWGGRIRTSAWRNQIPLPYRSSLFGNRPMHPPSQLLLVAPTAAGPYCAAGRTACFRSVRAGGDVDELRYAVGLIVMAAIRFWASRVWSNHGLRSRPAAKTAARSADAFLHSATRSTGCRHSVDSSAPRAATIWPTTLGNRSVACCHPISSRHSKLLLMKSSEGSAYLPKVFV